MKYTDLNFLKFLMFDVHNISEVLSLPKHSDFDEETISMFIKATKDIADKELYPYFQEFDKYPAKYEDGGIKIHPQLDYIFNAIVESGWVGSHFSPENGGMNLPHMVEGAAGHIFSSANNHVTGYLALTVGSANLITSFGSQEQIDTYVPKMLSSDWMGTMCLTEPEAGSALGNLRTSATLTEDGHYKIKGQKIFISGGDHQFADNFIHLVIARIDGAPKGSKGISLFIVPKHRLKEDGSLEFNDVLTAGDYQKMGQKGYCTAHLIFGENDNCHGYLVGEPNKGLKYMFQMMNQARLEVGITATSIAMSSYYHSLQYSKERLQGKKLSDTGERSTTQAPIIEHADVRRMLLMQKSVAFGSMSLLMESFKLYDMMESAEGEEKNDYHLLLELLTPMAKAFPSEYGLQAANNGMQVLGGYGYTIDFPLEQLARDIRITSIYEGTTTIHGMDILGRKVTSQNGKALLLLMEHVNKTITEAKKHDELVKYAEKLEEGIKVIQKTLEFLLPFAFQKKYESYLKNATLFLELMSHVTISWQWLKMGLNSTDANKYKDEFYKGNLLAMKYYFNYELPKIHYLADTILNAESVTVFDGNDYIN